MSDENFGLVYIEPTTPEIAHFKDIIKKQGNKTCKEQMDVSIISESVKSFTFGFISLSRKAQLGRRSINSFIYLLNSFILCVYNSYIPDELSIELVCSINKTGKLLIEVTEEKAKSMNIKRLTLNCLAIPKLQKWYESLGFVYIRTIFLAKDAPKVYYMVKKI